MMIRRAAVQASKRDAMISREYRLFLRRWLKNPVSDRRHRAQQPRLADAMARQVPRGGSGPVIELGGGTGNITAGLLRAGIAASRLVVHRARSRPPPPSAAALSASSASCWAMRRRWSTRAALRHQRADAVVSGLPLLIFPRKIQDAIVRNGFRPVEARCPLHPVHLRALFARGPRAHGRPRQSGEMGSASICRRPASGSIAARVRLGAVR